MKNNISPKHIASSEVLKALAHPVRLRIVDGLLSARECNVDKIVRGLGLPQSTVSQHLGILRSKGIVNIRREGVKVCYRVAHPAVAGILKSLGLIIKE